MQTGKSTKLITISLVGWLLLSFPLLSIFSTTSAVMGIPVLFLYVFAIWIVFIALTFWVTKFGNGK